jgi:hypothetical protein
MTMNEETVERTLEFGTGHFLEFRSIGASLIESRFGGINL